MRVTSYNRRILFFNKNVETVFSQVAPVFTDLYRRSAIEPALAEKANATALWSEIVASAASLRGAIPDDFADGGADLHAPIRSF